MSIFGDQFERVVFLLSTGRTGTKALAQYFDQSFDNVCALHEPPPSRRLRVASNRYLAKRLSRHQLVEQFTEARRPLFANVKERIYIESNPFLHGFVDTFDILFKEPRLVHIVRDPRTYVRSYLNFGAFRGIKGLAARYYPFWMLKPEQVNAATPKKWLDMSEIERLSWRWKTVNAELERAEKLHGSRYLRVRFEDVFAEDGSGLRELAGWIGLPTDRPFERLREEKVNASTAQHCPKWENWSAADQKTLLDLCSEQMQRYGYDVAP